MVAVYRKSVCFVVVFGFSINEVNFIHNISVTSSEFKVQKNDKSRPTIITELRNYMVTYFKLTHLRDPRQVEPFVFTVKYDQKTLGAVSMNTFKLSLSAQKLRSVVPTSCRFHL